MTLWTVARQTPLSMGFSRQEYWSGLPFPSPGGLPGPGINPVSPTLQADSVLSCPLSHQGVVLITKKIPKTKTLNKRFLGFSGSPVVKNPPANAGDMGPIPGWGRSARKGNGNPLQYSCLRNPMDRGVWRATVHSVTEDSNITRQLNNNEYCIKL